jgi:hypothetical protein
MSARRLYLAGWNGSGPDHWQYLWHQKEPGIWVEHADWAHPRLDVWLDDLEAAARSTCEPLTVVAHSLGCRLALAWAARRGGLRPHRFFLVAPPAPEKLLAVGLDPAFASPFAVPTGDPGLILGSSNDPYASLDHARALAREFGFSFVNAGALGHINAESGLGAWSEGLQWLRAFETESRERV